MPTRRANTPEPTARRKSAGSGSPPDRPDPTADDVAGSIGATVSGPARLPRDNGASLGDASLQRLAQQKALAQASAQAVPHNANKAAEHGIEAGRHPPQGAHLPPSDEIATASTVQEDVASPKVGQGSPDVGVNMTIAPLDRVRADAGGRMLTTNQGVPIADNQNSLKFGSRGPTLLEDFVLREKITHFDHERIPERVVHARGSGAHGVFECDESLADITRAGLFSDAGKRTPVFVRFSTVAGERGSMDTARDTRGFAVKFYTEEGNWDLVGNNMPVFFIQDAMKFPDLVHAVKPEPHHQMPQASSAHDTFWDFISLMPESIHHVLWVMSDRGIPRSYRTMQGFGVHTFRFVNEAGASVFVKFHWLPVAGTHSLVWDEAVKIGGADPDFHRRDLWESIEAGCYPEYELAIQTFSEEEAEGFSFDVLDATKIVPEELVPLRVVGKLTLNRNPDNFFAETEQVAFCTQHVVPGIDFSNDPLLQGRNHSYLDTQLSRLGGPNFHEIPINAPVVQVHNNQRDGFHRQAIHRGRVNYEPNSLAGGCPFQAGQMGFMSLAEPAPAEHKVRAKPEKFADHYSQARLFYRSQTPVEQQHIAAAFRFELSRCTVPAIRERVVSVLANVDEALAAQVAADLGMAMPEPQPLANGMRVESEVPNSPALSLRARPGDGRPVGRRIALLVQDGIGSADAKALRALQAGLAELQAMPRIVGAKLGVLQGDVAEPIEIETTAEAMPSVLWDAAVVCGTPFQQAPVRDARILEFLREQYRHGKPMLVLGDPTAMLAACGIPSKLLDGQPDPGLIVADGVNIDSALRGFVGALARHRILERETDPPLV